MNLPKVPPGFGRITDGRSNLRNGNPDILSGLVENSKANDLEETIKRIQGHKGVVGMMIVNNDGIAVRSNMDATITNQYCAVISRLADQARSTIRDLDPTNDITFLRLRSKKNEVLIAPGNKINLILLIILKIFS